MRGIAWVILFRWDNSAFLPLSGSEHSPSSRYNGRWRCQRLLRNINKKSRNGSHRMKTEHKTTYSADLTWRTSAFFFFGAFSSSSAKKILFVRTNSKMSVHFLCLHSVDRLQIHSPFWAILWIILHFQFIYDNIGIRDGTGFQRFSLGVPVPRPVPIFQNVGNLFWFPFGGIANSPPLHTTMAKFYSFSPCVAG